MDENVVIPVVCFIGRSGSGKTTLLERLIPALIERGYRVAAVKHAAHGHEVDRHGSDSYRFRQAGAETVAVISDDTSTIFLPGTPGSDHTALQTMVSEHVRGADIVLAEGFSASDFPKILVERFVGRDDGASGKGDGKDMVAGDILLNLTDGPSAAGLPVLPPGNIDKIADFIESRLLKTVPRKMLSQQDKNISCPGTCRSSVRLIIDGRRIPLNRFTSAVLSGTVLSIVKNLKGCKEVDGEVEISCSTDA